MNFDTPKLLVIGSARHGKDTFAEILRDRFDITFKSSSQAAADIFIYDALKDKYGYKSPVECFEDRVNHRTEWYEMICEYNKEDRTSLARGILNLADMYVGMRDRDEIKVCMDKGLFDLIVWIDASKRLPEEPAASFNIDKSCADIIIENNGTLEEFTDKVLRFGKSIMRNEPKPILDTEKDVNFLDLFSVVIEEDEDEEGWVDINIDNFFDEYYIYGWPELTMVDPDDGEEYKEDIDFENSSIVHLDENGITMMAGGDWQKPTKLVIKNKGEKIFVDSWGEAEWDSGLDTEEIVSILKKNQKKLA